ncbi:hypothetical protein QQ045_007741 [Rhodiola kirilowii]
MKGGKSKAESKAADSRLSVKSKAGAKKGTKATKKAAKDPNKPKRPASAFFVFMEDFRKQFKEENPNNKSVAAVGKAGGEKWKSLSDAEKAPYVAKAEKRKTQYEKDVKAYEKKQTDGAGADEESDKSKSEVEDDDNDDQSESGEEDSE